MIKMTFLSPKFNSLPRSDCPRRRITPTRLTPTPGRSFFGSVTTIRSLGRISNRRLDRIYSCLGSFRRRCSRTMIWRRCRLPMGERLGRYRFEKCFTSYEGL